MRKDYVGDLNAPCITCIHVVELKRCVAIISNAGGDYQAICGEDDHGFDDENSDNIDDAVVVHIKHILDIDPSVNHIFSLKYDWSSKRKDLEDKWVDYYDPD